MWKRCSRCKSENLVELEGVCFDRDGIRPARRCTDCRTIFASYASGSGEIGLEDYKEIGLPWPQHIIDEEQELFHEKATRRGYFLNAADTMHLHGVCSIGNSIIHFHQH